jgi:hypothetical protein
MHKKLYPIARLIVLFSMVTLTGQATARTGLAITTEGNSRAYLADIVYNTTEDGLEVKGVIKRRFHNGRIRGHVDVAFVDASGKILKSGSSKPKRINYSNKHQHRATFKILFNELPVGATTLQVVHHIGTEGH